MSARARTQDKAVSADVETKSLENAVKADLEDKADEAPADAPADEAPESDLPVQVVTAAVLPDSGVTPHPPVEGELVKFHFAHPVGKVRLDDKDLSGEEYAPGDEVDLPRDVADALARAGAGRLV